MESLQKLLFCNGPSPSSWFIFFNLAAGNLTVRRVHMLISNRYTFESESENCSVVTDSLRQHGLHNPCNSPGQSSGVGSLSLLQGIFPTQGSNPVLPHCRKILYQLSHQGSCRNNNFKSKPPVFYYNNVINTVSYNKSLWFQVYHLTVLRTAKIIGKLLVLFSKQI